jgi:hypothetical protein
MGVFRGRLLFNMQQYWKASEPVPRHRDGEVFAAEIVHNERLSPASQLPDVETVDTAAKPYACEHAGSHDTFVKSALHPRLVTLITLQNDTEGGGTRLHYPDDEIVAAPTVRGNSVVVRAKAGDLLLFDNVTSEHSVDRLYPRDHPTCHDSAKLNDAEHQANCIRQLVGWRAMEEGCVHLHDGAMRDVDYAAACRLQRHFLACTWPRKRKELELLGQL